MFISPFLLLPFFHLLLSFETKTWRYLKILPPSFGNLFHLKAVSLFATVVLWVLSILNFWFQKYSISFQSLQPYLARLWHNTLRWTDIVTKCSLHLNPVWWNPSDSLIHTLVLLSCVFAVSALPGLFIPIYAAVLFRVRTCIVCLSAGVYVLRAHSIKRLLLRRII
jgi:hypothetical protein